jgi:putative ABC transport system permease protein
MGATFAADANLVTSDNTFLYFLPKADTRLIQIGLIKTRPGYEPAAVKAMMASTLSKDVMVLTKQEPSELELNYWKKNFSAGFIFSLSVLVGFVVGSILAYQILCRVAINSLPQFATLKAMGYRDCFVISIVIL